MITVTEDENHIYMHLEDYGVTLTTIKWEYLVKLHQETASTLNKNPLI